MPPHALRRLPGGSLPGFLQGLKVKVEFGEQAAGYTAVYVYVAKDGGGTPSQGHHLSHPCVSVHSVSSMPDVYPFARTALSGASDLSYDC